MQSERCSDTSSGSDQLIIGSILAASNLNAQLIRLQTHRWLLRTVLFLSLCNFIYSQYLDLGSLPSPVPLPGLTDAKTDDLWALQAVFGALVLSPGLALLPDLRKRKRYEREWWSFFGIVVFWIGCGVIVTLAPGPILHATLWIVALSGGISAVIILERQARALSKRRKEAELAWREMFTRYMEQ